MNNPFPNVGSPSFYLIFFIVIIFMLAIDFACLKKTGAHKISSKEALIWSVVWVVVSALFALWLYFELANNPLYGAPLAKEKVLEFLTAYVLEKSLAVDNIFVFIMIFTYFKIPAAYQHRVLLYGVFGAIIMRAVMIFIGATLVREFAWILYLFGVFLVYSGLMMLRPATEEADFSQNIFLKPILKYLPMSETLAKENFFTIENGKRLATPLFLVLIMIEISDLIFSIDSIPAVFAVTTDPFIVLSSNIFAILGLRAMFFLLADIVDRFVYLKYGLAFVLCFIGIKMLIVKWLHIPIAISLLVVFLAFTIAIGASFWRSKKSKNQ